MSGNSTVNDSILVPARAASAPLDRWDFVYLGALLILWFCLVAVNYDALPLQTWDEARLANNALEIARGGHWLVPSYDGVPDHWYTKPPLLVWQLAALMQLGLPPLLAVRLPTMIAGLATVSLVWAICRFGLGDRVAAVVGSFLLLSSLLFSSIHVARTGDPDILSSFFMLCYALAFWKSI